MKLLNRSHACDLLFKYPLINRFDGWKVAEDSPDYGKTQDFATIILDQFQREITDKFLLEAHYSRPIAEDLKIEIQAILAPTRKRVIVRS